MVTLSPTEQLVLARFRERVTAVVGDGRVRLVLFGSRARGEGHEESDLDVLVVLSSSSMIDLATRRAIQDIAAELTFEYDIRVSPLIRDESFYLSCGLLCREIRRDGVEL